MVLHIDFYLERKCHYDVTIANQTNNATFKSIENSARKPEVVRSNSEKKYRDLYENSPALYRTINTDGIIIDCNQSYAERFGYTKEEVIGTSIFDHSA
ncbi:MAG TPA: PAS domain S-box protein, partial [Nitrosopumilaceae archaeon]|nr:PAS domain S-box protein [Nitrosopumilaceae archaeon]